MPFGNGMCGETIYDRYTVAGVQEGAINLGHVTVESGIIFQQSILRLNRREVLLGMTSI